MSDSRQEQGNKIGLAAGSKIGKYEVVSRIAIGGQAIIYKCYDAVLDRYVAIKQISSHLAEDPRFLERFRGEAQILARLGAEQSEIVTIHDLLEDQQGLFIVMEFVKGIPLEVTLRDNPQPVEVKATLQILWRLCAALHAVHSAGIVHRDIKPSNIIIGEGLRPTITDFGVAASMSGESSMVLGTTKYMAPELFAGQSIDGRADMYSLGMIAYEMLLGREKFNEVFADIVRDKHAESLRWMKWHSNENVSAPPVHEINPAVPVSLSHLVSQMMAKDPAQRFESMETLGRAIKKSFSPKAKAVVTPGAVAPSIGEEPELQLAQIQQPEQAEVFEEEAPTEALPGRKLSRKAKFAIAAIAAFVILSGLVTMAVMDIRQKGQRQEAARSAYRKALRLYDEDAKYYEAQKRFSEIQEGYKNLIFADQASVFVRMCQARIAIEAGEWDEAKQAEEYAQERLKELQRSWPDKEAYRAWLKKMGMAVESLGKTRLDLQQFAKVLKRAELLLEEGDRDGAMTLLRDEYGEGAGLGQVQREQLNRLQTLILRKGYESDCRNLIQAAHSLRLEGKQVEARSQYIRAEAKLTNKDALILSDQVRRGLLREVKAALVQVNQGLRLADIKESVETARQSGDDRKLLIELQAAVEFEGLPASQLKSWKTEIVRLRQAEKLEEIGETIKAGRGRDAIALLNDFLKEYPDHESAKVLLKGVRLKTEFETAKAKGMRLYRQRRWKDAIEPLSQADTMQQDAEIRKSLRECRYRLEMSELRRLLRDKKYREAEVAAEKARQIWPEKAQEEVVPLMISMRNQEKVSNTLAEARKAIEAKKFSKAKALLKPLRGMPEADELVSLTRYSEEIHKGKSALERRDHKTAIACLNLAKKFAANDKQLQEVRKLLNQAYEMKTNK